MLKVFLFQFSGKFSQMVPSWSLSPKPLLWRLEIKMLALKAASADRALSCRLCLCPSFGDIPGAGEKGKGFRASLQQKHLQELKSRPVDGESQCAEGSSGMSLSEPSWGL